jgi:3-oxoacyl-(acyl-carrier-protein) synthase
MSSPHPEGLGAHRHAERAETAQLDAADIDYINLHAPPRQATTAETVKPSQLSVRARRQFHQGATGHTLALRAAWRPCDLRAGAANDLLPGGLNTSNSIRACPLAYLLENRSSRCVAC